MFDVLIRNGRVVDGSGLPWFHADVGVTGDRVAAVGRLGNASAKQVIDAAGKVVCPGFVDAHVHGDLVLLADPLHEQGVRQGVTTHVIGQDGVAFAPGCPETQAYMRQYTAGFNGNFPTPGREWRTVTKFLSQFDGQCSINVCTLIPNGNVRMEVMGLDPRKPTADELKQMRAIIREGMEQGAVGISSGLDYVPSIYADEDELSELCAEIAPYGGVYVTHMRGYNEQKAPAALQEVFNIGRRAGCGVHVSHFNCLADQTIPLLDAARADGVDVTFDLYCYLYGSTIVAMLTLPPEILEGGIDATVSRLKNPAVRKELEAAFANPRFPIETIRLASLPHDEYRSLEGMTLPARRGRVRDPAFRGAAGVGHAEADAPPADDGGERRHLRRRQAAPARDGLLRAVPRAPRPQRRLDARRGRDEVRVPRGAAVRPEGPRPAARRHGRGRGGIRPGRDRGPFDLRRRQGPRCGRRACAGQRRRGVAERRADQRATGAGTEKAMIYHKGTKTTQRHTKCR